MELNVHKEVAALQRQGAKQLRARYAEVFGDTATANNKVWLIRRIAWRLQALAEGDLSERARRRAEELANDADLRLRPPAGARAGDMFSVTVEWRQWVTNEIVGARTIPVVVIAASRR